jgi:SAM-dependent methyltransferase
LNILKDPSIWKFPRKKKKNILLSIIYKLCLYLPFNKKFKFLFFSNLSWIFRRLAFEFSMLEKADEYVPYKVRYKFIKDKLSKNTNLVDLGCAYGVDSRFLAAHVNSVIAVDHDKKAIEVAKNLNNQKNITYVNEDVFQWLEKSKKNYEIIFCSHILEHLDDPIHFLQSCKLFFKYIYIEVPDNDQDEHSFLRILNGFQPLFNDTDHIWEFKRKDLESLFNDLNLKIIDEQKIYGSMRFWLKC